MGKLIAFYDSKPKAIEAVGDGSYLYRWDIKESIKDKQTQYECFEVVVKYPLSSNSIIEAVFEELYGNNVEAKLLNDYYSAVHGVLDESYKQAYIDFLNKRKELKTKIGIDYASYRENVSVKNGKYFTVTPEEMNELNFGMLSLGK